MKTATFLLLATTLVASAEPRNDHSRTANRTWTYRGDRGPIVNTEPYYRYRRANPGLPPGLAKRNGNLPPGLEKQERHRGQLPPGLEKRFGASRIVLR